MSEVIVDEVPNEIEDLNTFLANKENKENCLNLANQIESIVGKNWFSLDRLVVKSRENKLVAYQKLKLCAMFNFAISKKGTWKEGAENIRKELFKITIDSSYRIEAIDDIINSLKEQIKVLELERASLENLKKGA